MPLLATLPGAGGTPDIELVHCTLPHADKPTIFSSPFVTLYAEGDAKIEIAGASLAIMVSAGRHILVEAAAETPQSEIMTFLLGPALGILCHQRRALPLHAAAIDVGGRVVALVGASGAGKSTCAAALVRRGHRLLGDDIAVIDPVLAVVRPTYPGIKLWQDAADRLEINTAALSRTRAGLEKFHYPAAASAGEGSPLGAVILLQRRAQATAAELVPLTKIAALAQLGPHIYRRPLAKLLGAEQACLTRLGQLISSVPVMALARPDGFVHFDETIKIIEEVGAV